jgi:Family of unknown function (DUF6152)
MAAARSPRVRGSSGVDLEDNVNNKVTGSLLVVVGLLVAVVPLFAHHGNAAYVSKTLTLKGTVTAWMWTNPHVFLKVDVKDDKGEVVNWVAELVAPSNMINFGFSGQTFKPGDEITIVTNAVAKSGAPVVRLAEVRLANGQVMRTEGKYDGRAEAAADHKANEVK